MKLSYTDIMELYMLSKETGVLLQELYDQRGETVSDIKFEKEGEVNWYKQILAEKQQEELNKEYHGYRPLIFNRSME